MYKKFYFLAFAVLLANCSSVSLVDNWKNPDIVLFDASKVLVVGIAQDEEARATFETRMQREFEKRDVGAMRSLDVFDVDFTASEQTEEALDDVEQRLLDKDFDAILLTKVIGSTDRKTLRSKLSNVDRYYDMFHDDYLENQGIYQEQELYDTYKVFHAETTLYCICVGKERQVIWKGAIDVTDPKNVNKVIDDYVKLVVLAMQEQDLIFRNTATDEITGL